MVTAFEAVKNIKLELPKHKYTKFLGLANGNYAGFARVYVLASEIVNYTDNKIVVGYAVDYFEKFVEIENVDEYNVTVKMLKVAQNNQLADYNMDELNKCEEDSFVKFTLKKGKNGYERFESALICQK